MSRRALIHTASVKRESRTQATYESSFTAYATFAATVRCLVEPMGTYRQATILGNIAQGRFHFTWGSEALLDGDQITWNGKIYRLSLGSNDQFRTVGSRMIGYQTGTIEEEITYRS